MSMKNIDLSLVSHDLVQDLKWSAELREEFAQDEAAVLDRYDLEPAERTAIEKRDFYTLYAMGFHPYLGAQFSRILFAHNSKGAVPAVQRLLASIRQQPLEEEPLEEEPLKELSEAAPPEPSQEKTE